MMKEKKPFSSRGNRPEKRDHKGTRPNKDKRDKELKYYGFHACFQLWRSRPDAIMRIYIEERHVKEAGSLLKWCASKGKAYHVISAEEMCKVSDSIHHEGLCIVANELPSVQFDDMFESLKTTEGPLCLLYIDGVQNPHNIGSIMRVCAHFGISYILGQKTLLPKVSPSAYRIAQGGAEYVKLVPLENPLQSLKRLQNIGFRAVASSSHGGKTLYNHRFAPRTLLVMGSESEGVNVKLLESIKETLLIPGTGSVESLNVSVATGLFLGEYWRQIKVKES